MYLCARCALVCVCVWWYPSQEISPHQVKLQKRIDGGFFGDIYTGIWQPVDSDVKIKVCRLKALTFPSVCFAHLHVRILCQVAIKTLRVKEEERDEQRQDMLKEMTTMAQLNHPKVRELVFTLSPLTLDTLSFFIFFRI